MNSALRRRHEVLHVLALADAAGYFDTRDLRTASNQAQELLGTEYEDLVVECIGTNVGQITREPGETDAELRMRITGGFRWRWRVNGSTEEDFK